MCHKVGKRVSRQRVRNWHFIYVHWLRTPRCRLASFRSPGMDSFGEEGELPEDGSRSVAQSQGAGGVGGDGTSETAVPSPQEVADPVEAIRGKLNVLAGAVQHLELELLPYMKGAVEECKAATAATSAAWREQQEVRAAVKGSTGSQVGPHLTTACAGASAGRSGRRVSPALAMSPSPRPPSWPK